MVPLRLDVSEERSCPAAAFARPHLVLTDMTQEQAAPRPRRRSSWNRLENVLLATAAMAVLLFFLFSCVGSLFHAVQQSYHPAVTPSVVTIPYTVHRGDTLTRLASRYSDPSAYILDSEEQIARANHLSGTTPLLPGQHLLIPVTNHAVIARLERSSLHVAFLPR